MQVPLEVSARHIHLSKEILEQLFGEGYQLKSIKKISQPEQFAAEETVAIIGSKGKLERVRVVGPIRDHTQIEISKTDSFILGLEVPVKISGDIKGTPGFKVVGPQSEVELEQGLIVAKRHLHLSPKQAKELNLKKGDEVSVKVTGERGLIFNKVEVRTGEKHEMAVHLDTDEANTAGVKQGDSGFLVC